jgi:GNAT superfamily N-acetyltransferase
MEADQTRRINYKWGVSREGDVTVFAVKGGRDGKPYHRPELQRQWGRQPRTLGGDVIGAAQFRPAEMRLDGSVVAPASVEIQTYYGGAAPPGLVARLRELHPGAEVREAAEVGSLDPRNRWALGRTAAGDWGLEALHNALPGAEELVYKWVYSPQDGFLVWLAGDHDGRPYHEDSIRETWGRGRDREDVLGYAVPIEGGRYIEAETYRNIDLATAQAVRAQLRETFPESEILMDGEDAQLREPPADPDPMAGIRPSARWAREHVGWALPADDPDWQADPEAWEAQRPFIASLDWVVLGAPGDFHADIEGRVPNDSGGLYGRYFPTHDLVIWYHQPRANEREAYDAAVREALAAEGAQGGHQRAPLGLRGQTGTRTSTWRSRASEWLRTRLGGARGVLPEGIEFREREIEYMPGIYDVEMGENVAAAGGWYYEAWLDGQQIAGMTVGADGSIDGIEVLPEYRRMGVATALKEYAEHQEGRSISHSVREEQTDEGAAWAERTAGADKDGAMVAVYHNEDALWAVPSIRGLDWGPGGMPDTRGLPKWMLHLPTWTVDVWEDPAEGGGALAHHYPRMEARGWDPSDTAHGSINGRGEAVTYHMPPGAPWERVLEEVEAAGRRLGTEKTAGADKEGAMVAIYLPLEELAQEGGEPVEDMHVTLLYFEAAAADRDDWEELHPVLEAIANRTPPLEGSVNGFGVFQNGEDVLWAAPSINGLADLRAELARAAEDAGFPVSTTYDWVPHLTLKYGWEGELPRLDGPVEISIPSLTLTVAEERTEFEFAGEGLEKAAMALRTAAGDWSIPDFHDWKTEVGLADRGSDTGVYNHPEDRVPWAIRLNPWSGERDFVTGDPGGHHDDLGEDWGSWTAWGVHEPSTGRLYMYQGDRSDYLYAARELGLDPAAVARPPRPDPSARRASGGGDVQWEVRASDDPTSARKGEHPESWLGWSEQPGM